MVHSLLFWFLLLISPVVYWAMPQRFRTAFLALLSMGYVATLEPAGMVTMTVLALLVYWFAPRAAGVGTAARRIFPMLVLTPLTYLVYYKYLPILHAAALVYAATPGAGVARTIVIPIGISYFCFKLLHYTIEVRRDAIPSHSLPEYLSYVFLFPIFTAGPIERFDHFLWFREDDWHRQSTIDGLTRILQGLIKKFTIAALVYNYLSEKLPLTAGGPALVNHMMTLPPYKLWAAMILLYLYFYFDFSAYSDIAIGGSRLFGLRILENFEFPLSARNISEYWKRWHMTLSGWCQSYIYMPTIGWSRNPYIAVYCSFFVMGMWHAASPARLGWALHHATGVAVYQTWSRLKRKRKWTHFDGGVWNYPALALTFLYVAASGVYLIADGIDPYSSLRLLAKLFYIDLAA